MICSDAYQMIVYFKEVFGDIETNSIHISTCEITTREDLLRMVKGNFTNCMWIFTIKKAMPLHSRADQRNHKRKNRLRLQVASF